MRKLLFTAIAVIFGLAIMAQPNYDYSKLQREKLNRGVVAVKTPDGHVAVSWRTLSSDPKAQPYDVYRNGVKLNTAPLTTGGTFFIDEHPLTTDATYTVSAADTTSGGFAAGSYTLPADAPVGTRLKTLLSAGKSVTSVVGERPPTRRPRSAKPQPPDQPDLFGSV